MCHVLTKDTCRLRFKHRILKKKAENQLKYNPKSRFITIVIMSSASMSKTLLLHTEIFNPSIRFPDKRRNAQRQNYPLRCNVLSVSNCLCKSNCV